MNRLVPVLGVLLLASVIVNAVLLARLSRPEEPAPGPSKTAVRRAASDSADEPDLRSSLELERKRTQELQARVEHLETDKKVLAADGPGSKVDRLAELKEKLRRYRKILRGGDEGAQAGQEPESMIEASEAMIEVMKIAAMRAKNPARYAETMAALVEVSLEGEGTGLSAADLATVSKLYQDLAEGIGRLPTTPAGDRLLKEIEMESAAMSKLRGMLSKTQVNLLDSSPFAGTASASSYNTEYIDKKSGVDGIVSSWMGTYGLEDAQMASAKAAAQSFLDAMARLEAEKGRDPAAFSQSWPAEGYASRLRSLQQQLAALKTLESAMTSDQRALLASRRPKEFVLYSETAAQIEVQSSDK